MTMVKAAEDQSVGPPPAELMQAINELGMEAASKGVMVEMGGLLPSAAGSRIQLKAGKLRLSDGPFSEAKEVVGGYAVYDVPTREEALEWARRFMELHQNLWKGWEGEVEVRQLMEMPGPDAQS